MVEEIRNFEGLTLGILDTQKFDLLIKPQKIALTAPRGKLAEQFKPRCAECMCEDWLWLSGITVIRRHGADALLATHYRGRGNTRCSAYCAKWSDRGGRIGQ